MSVIITVLVLTIIFGMLVGIHEFGHFIVAKLQGIWVQEFAFGFGPQLFSFESGETLYRVNLVPLGGYVKLFGEQKLHIDDDLKKEFMNLGKKEEGRLKELIKKYKLAKIEEDEALREKINSIQEISEEDKDWIWGLEMTKESRVSNSRRYSNKTIFQRLTVVCGGVIMNLILGIIIYVFYLLLLNSQTVLPRIVDYKFLGADTEVLMAPFINIDGDNYEELDNSLMIKINDVVLTDLDKLNQSIDNNLNQKVELYYFNIGKGQFESVELVLNNDAVDHIFHNYVFLNKPHLNEVIENEPASLGGLMAGDVILSIQNEEIDFESMKAVLDKYKGTEVEMMVLRDETEMVLVEGIKLNDPTNEDQPILGTIHSPYLPFDFRNSYYIDYHNSLSGGFFHSINMIGYQVDVLKEIFSFAIKNNEPGILGETVAGPIRVGAEVNNLVKGNNINDIINITALISLTLALMNILPLPVVDGGHVVLLAFEKLRGRPLSERSQKIYNLIGLVFIMGLTLVVTVKDVWQVFIRR